MCEYIDKNKCKLTKESCPYMYFCNKEMSWKESNTMPKECNIKKKHLNNTPKGMCKVAFERKGNLYIEVDDYIQIVKNPFDMVPEFVKIGKNKQGNYYIKR